MKSPVSTTEKSKQATQIRMTDLEIAHATKLDDIGRVAASMGIAEEDLERYGHHIAKLPLRLIDEARARRSKLILVTAITATKAGIGKTTVSIGLALGLNRIGRRAVVALREPSLGPCFGMKGGAAGGGHAQVLPMERINLHFTGDFHAITSAHNMISALLDNYIYQHQADGFALKEVCWRRVLDVNDRSLRSIVTGLGPRTNGVPAESGFDITPASELMAILCLAADEDDLRRRVESIILGFTYDDRPFTVKDLGVAGAIVVLLRDALQPNLVQTTERTPALVHGGPLGAEKFYDILCRKSGLAPALTVIVATAQGLKMHGGVPLDDIAKPDLEGLRRGLANLDRHVSNLRSFGQTVLVAFNRFAADTDDEMELLRRHCEDELHAPYVVNDAYARGGEGAEEMARLVVDTIERQPSAPLRLAYDDTDPLATKIEKVARQIYGAGSVSFAPAARRRLQQAEALGLGTLPVCIAKTQFSFSADAKRYGAVEGFDFAIRDAVINAGAGMIVAIAGDILRMPGLPKSPQALRIDYADGHITGLS